MWELQRRFRLANRALAVTIPVMVLGAILLRGAGEAVLQVFGPATLFLGIALYLSLEVRHERHRHGDQ